MKTLELLELATEIRTIEEQVIEIEKTATHYAPLENEEPIQLRISTGKPKEPASKHPYGSIEHYTESIMFRDHPIFLKLQGMQKQWGKERQELPFSIKPETLLKILGLLVEVKQAERLELIKKFKALSY